MHDCGNTSSTSNASLKRILPPVFMSFLSTLALLMHQVTLKDSRGVENTKTPKILDWVAWFSKKLWTWSSPLSASGQNILQIFFLTIHNHSLTSKICFELGLFKIHVKEFNYERKNGSKKVRKKCHWQSDLYPPIGGHHPVLYFTIQIFKHFSQKDSSICYAHQTRSFWVPKSSWMSGQNP